MMLDPYRKNKKYSFWIQFLTLFAMLATSVMEGNLSILVLYFILLLPRFILGKNKVLYDIVYNVTVFIGILFYYSLLNHYGAPYYVGGSDDWAYELASKDILLADNWTNPDYLQENRYLLWDHNSPFYVIILAALRIFCDSIDSFHTIAPKVLNASFLAIISFFVLKISRSFFSKKDSVRIAYASGLFPTSIAIACHSFRDTIVAFLFFLIIYRLEISKKNVRSFLFSLILLCVVCYFMFYLRKLFVPIIIIVFFTRYYMELAKNKISIKAILILCTVLVAVMISLDVSFEEISGKSEIYSAYRANELSSGLGAMLFNMSILPFGIILRYFYLLVPFQIPVEFSLVFACFGYLVQFFFVPFFIYGSFVLFKNNRPLRTYIIFTQLFIIMIALTSFTWRHLTIVFPFFVMFAIQGYQYMSRYDRKRVLILSMIVMVILFMGYLILKSLI